MTNVSERLCNVLGLKGTFILGKKQYFHELLWDDEGLSQEDPV